MDGLAVGAGNLHDGKQVKPAVRGRCGVDYGPARLLAELGAIEFFTCWRRLLSGDVGQIHALFQAPQKVHAGDDFLAGITAFIEADAAYEVQIRHLRHELVLGSGCDPRDTGADFEPVPII